MRLASKLYTVLFLFDIFILAGSFLIISWIKPATIRSVIPNNFYYLLVVITVWVISSLIFDKYRLKRFLSIKSVFRTIYKSNLVVVFISLGLIVFLKIDLSRFLYFGTIILSTLLEVVIFSLIFSYYKINKTSSILLLGFDRSSESVLKTFKNDDPYSLYKDIDLNFATNDSKIVDYSILQLKDLLHKEKYSEFVIGLPLSYRYSYSKLIDTANYNGIRVRVIPDYYKYFGKNYKIRFYQNIPYINVNEIPLDKGINSLVKRVFDILFSIVVLICFIPFHFLLSMIIKIESKGPVIYKPIRLGRDQKEFSTLKYRSMKVCDSANGGTKSTEKNDPRITKIGKFIRRYNIDEIPQFINVLRGDMSVVGPRPHRVVLNKELQTKVDKYMMRHYVKPGITGWAQVNGWRGPTETKEQKEMRTKYDLWYIENWSFWLDLKIIFLTIFGKKVKKNAF